ncbi:MAG: hypothetical protein AAF943_13885 [Pseudomonadota bacterium]
MIRLRAFSALVAAIVVAGCASDSILSPNQPSTRLDTAPMAFSQNPKLTSQLSQTFVTNRAELQAAAQHLQAEELDRLPSAQSETVSSRAALSPL